MLCIKVRQMDENHCQKQASPGNRYILGRHKGVVEFLILCLRVGLKVCYFNMLEPDPNCDF